MFISIGIIAWGRVKLRINFTIIFRVLRMRQGQFENFENTSEINP
jgi:hypothetical protein